MVTGQSPVTMWGLALGALVPASPTGIVLAGYQKGVLLCVLLGLLYLRLYRRKRLQDRICSHCGQRNPAHQTNCRKCSAPLFMK